MPRTLTSDEAAAARALIDGGVRQRDLRAWAAVILGDIQDGCRVPSAIQHPLGFTCIQLYRGPGWGLCLHIWMPSRIPEALPATTVHSHSWDLSSQVICGQLENGLIRITENEAVPTNRIVEIRSDRGTDVIRPTSRLVCWEYVASVRVAAGVNYNLPAGTFHVSRPIPSGLTATVLLAEDRYDSPELALGQIDAHSYSVTRQSCGADDLRRMAGVTLRNLSGKTGRPHERR